MADLIQAYQQARQHVIDAGYADDIEWQQWVNFEKVDTLYFWQNAAHVILNSGMRAVVIAKVWPAISEAFGEWENLAYPVGAVEQALKVFNNRPKIEAIAKTAELLRQANWEALKDEIRREGVIALQQFPFIGPITSYHLAKNIGLDVAKPDRHLVRMAQACGYDDVQVFCRAIAAGAGDSVPVVDIVLWRYATLDPGYLNLFAGLKP